MKHSEALTEQKQLDCIAVLGKDWDSHCEAVLENISKDAARRRLDQTFAQLAGLDAATQTAVITSMLAAVPSEGLKVLNDAAVGKIAELAVIEPVEAIKE